MKLLYLALGGAALLLAACNQTPPATEQATAPATTPVVAEAPAAAPAAARPDSTVASLKTVAATPVAAAVLSEPTSSDLAVLNEDARHLRIVQRRVEETAPEGGKFETAREIVLSANTKIEVVPMPKSAKK